MTKRISDNEFNQEEFVKNINKTLQSKWFWIQLTIGLLLGLILFSPAILVFVVGIMGIALIQAFYKPINKIFDDLKGNKNG
tara:strand:- start:1536 stop:1778 length:243 start_codon:yes stop_codon:yes gene_type:complete